MSRNCSTLQQSLAWCMGTPELPGIRRRIYYIAKSKIAQWPTYVRDNSLRSQSAALNGSFVLVADEKWKYIDILADKSQLTSEPQGEIPSQTQLNKLTAVHPGVGPQAAAAACYLNNSDNVFIVEDMKGMFRVVGSEKWITKTTVAQDNGQGPTGATSTTINVEATDEVPAPFYSGIIETEDGDIDCTDIEGASGVNSGGNSGSNSGGNSGGSSSGSASFSNTVIINGSSRSVSQGTVTVNGPLTSLAFTGSNMDFIFLHYGNNEEDEANIASNKASASWSGNIAGPATVRVSHGNGNLEQPEDIEWFTIEIVNGSSSGGSGSGSVAAPTISGDTTFSTSTQATISGPAGATIYYTLDGSTPTSSSAVYSSPLTLTETTSVKAIAVLNGISSSVASKTFVKSSGEGGMDQN